MRKLAAGCFSFGAGVLFAVYCGNTTAIIIAALIALLCGAVAIFKGKQGTLYRIISFSLVLGLVWVSLYNYVVYRPVLQMDDTKAKVTATVTDYPKEWKYGSNFAAKVDIGGRKTNTVVYSYKGGNLVPGDEITFEGKFSVVNDDEENSSHAMTSKGYALSAFIADDIKIIGHKDSVLYYPKIIQQKISDKIGELFDGETAEFLQAMLIGDRNGLNQDLVLGNRLSQVGIFHLIAVSGLHVSFLVGFIYLLIGRRKWSAFITVPMILFFMAVTGFTPSVTRAGIMQIAVIVAMVTDREDDSITSLGFSLLIILLVNPYSIAHAGLQMTFLATLGIILVAGRMSSRLIHLFNISKKKGRSLKRRIRDSVLYFIVSVFSASIGALVLTTPLIALYFGSVSIIAPIANLLIYGIASFIFAAGLVVSLLGLVWMPVATILAYPIAWAVKYVLFVAEFLSKTGLSAVYTVNKYVIIWLVYLYCMGILFTLLKGKMKNVTYLFSGAVCFLCAVMIVSALSFGGNNASVTALDVGQGECVVLTSGSLTAAVDCGSNYEDAGNILGDYIYSIGRSKLDALVISHYDYDHCSGVDELLERVDIGLMLLPEPDLSETKIAGKIISAAEDKGIEIMYVDRDYRLKLGDGVLNVFAPLTDSNENEMSLVSLFSYGEFDTLITGDIGKYTERILVNEKAIPDIELLVAGHHGSNTSTGEALLDAVKPDAVIISVGYNNHGHPSPKVLERLENIGAKIYRTDETGNVTIKLNEE